MLDEFLDLSSSVPADDRGRNLVSDTITEYCGVAGAAADPSPDLGFDLVSSVRLVQEGHLLAPVEPDHHPETVLLRHIKKPARRTSMNPYNIEPVLGDLGKISLYHLTSKALFPVLVYLEGAIADASNPELFFANKEKLPLHSGARIDKFPSWRGF